MKGRKSKKVSKPLKKAGWQPLFASIRARAFNHGVVNDTNGHQYEPSSLHSRADDPLIEVSPSQEAPNSHGTIANVGAASLVCLSYLPPKCSCACVNRF
jgi:hypothetical protein